MLAAATALDLAAAGEITARGRLASAIQPSRDQYVYDGDSPSPYRSAWQEAVAEAEAMMTRARTDPETARYLLVWLTHSSRSMIRFEDQRGLPIRRRHPRIFPAHRSRARPYRPRLRPVRRWRPVRQTVESRTHQAGAPVEGPARSPGCSESRSETGWSEQLSERVYRTNRGGVRGSGRPSPCQHQGRPTVVDDDKRRAILARRAEGESLRTICQGRRSEPRRRTPRHHGARDPTGRDGLSVASSAKQRLARSAC